MSEKRFGALSSSADPAKLSLTIQAAMKTVTGALIFFGVLTTTDANTAVEQVMAVVPLGYAMWNSAEILFGIARKALIAIEKKFRKEPA